MTNLDWMKLLALAVKDLDAAVKVYENAKGSNRWVRAGVEVPMHCSRSCRIWVILRLMASLLQLEKGL